MIMDEMEKEDMSGEIIIETNQTILTEGIFSTPQKLTPTGKISHAKTRVYTQRYRKEWEQMPDFKGWLTAVPDQPTRAFCIYCKKNLHAHRLSLLKHTCTMKHARAALLAQTEGIGKSSDQEDSAKASELETLSDFEEVTVVGAIKSISNEDEDVEEFEYVVESLVEEEEEEEEVEEEIDDPKDMDSNNQEEIEDTSLKMVTDEESLPKKIKLEQYPRRDTLAEAMAHVHGDYLDHNDEHQGTVGLDMEVESETTILPDNEEHLSSGDEKNEKSRIKHLHQEIVDSPGVGNSQKSKIVAYRINSTSIANLQGANTVTISTNNNKILTLNSGKTVTLNTTKIGGGTQYVLSKVKGHLPPLMMTESKSINHKPLATKSTLKSVQVANSVSVATTSAEVNQETQKPQETQKQNEVVRIPCISTHVLDTSKGTPITGLQVSLYKLMDGRWTFLNESTTSGSGRCTDLVNTGKSPFTAGRYKMHFDVDKYFTLRRIETLYPFIEIVFDVKNPTGNYHIPVLLSPFGYTTYRGSDR